MIKKWFVLEETDTVGKMDEQCKASFEREHFFSLYDQFACSTMNEYAKSCLPTLYAQPARETFIHEHTVIMGSTKLHGKTEQTRKIWDLPGNWYPYLIWVVSMIHGFSLFLSCIAVLTLQTSKPIFLIAHPCSLRLVFLVFWSHALVSSEQLFMHIPHFLSSSFVPDFLYYIGKVTTQICICYMLVPVNVEDSF